MVESAKNACSVAPGEVCPEVVDRGARDPGGISFGLTRRLLARGGKGGVSMLGAGGVTSASGNIVVNTVAAGTNAALTASDGAITDDGDDTTRISANAVT